MIIHFLAQTYLLCSLLSIIVFASFYYNFGSYTAVLQKKGTPLLIAAVLENILLAVCWYDYTDTILYRPFAYIYFALLFFIFLLSIGSPQADKFGAQPSQDTGGMDQKKGGGFINFLLIVVFALCLLLGLLIGGRTVYKDFMLPYAVVKGQIQERYIMESPQRREVGPCELKINCQTYDVAVDLYNTVDKGDQVYAEVSAGSKTIVLIRKQPNKT